MPLHVEQLRAVADPYRINAAVGDARDLDLGDGAMDAVLLLGPLYPLRPRDQRLRALRAGWRVVRPGGPVFVAAISRWAPWLDGELRPPVRVVAGDSRADPSGGAQRLDAAAVSRDRSRPTATVLGSSGPSCTPPVGGVGPGRGGRHGPTPPMATPPGA
jgi:SAM-dependent methyltransferase